MSIENKPTVPAAWEKLGDRSLAVTRILDLRAARYRHPVRGTEREFVLVATTNWVNVIALTPSGELVFVSQFRFGIDTLSLEIPGGVIDAGEDPVAAGVRELREETGYTGVRARLIGTVHPNPAFQTNRCYYVLVEEVVRSAELEWDADEEIAVSLAPVSEALALARTGRIAHALVLGALFCFEPIWAEINQRRFR